MKKTMLKMSKDMMFFLNRVERARPEDFEDDDVTYEGMRQRYTRCIEVLESINDNELYMLWHIRNSAYGTSYRFYKLALQNYNTYQETLELKTPIKTGE